jgi:hypothetical protein
MSLRNNNFFRFADTVGDASGTKNANVNGSVTPQVFRIQPKPGENYRVSRLIVTIQDVGKPDSGKYGNSIDLSAGTGIVVRLRRRSTNTVITDLTCADPVKTNMDWGKFCYDVMENSWGSGDGYVAVRWSFFKTGQEVQLDGNLGDCIEVTIADDLTGLTGHYFMFQGIVDGEASSDTLVTG